jgi:cysteine desulfurase/selenocysteine lyase
MQSMSVTARESVPSLEAEHWRKDFPILRRVLPNGAKLIYFDNAATTQRPRQVIDAIVQTYERHYANVLRGVHTLAEESDNLYAAAREKLRALINAPSAEQVIFTYGATSAINLVAHSWGDATLRSGDEILLTEMEHHSNLVPWQQLAARRGAVIRWIPITDDGLLELDALDRLLSDRTRLVAVTAVSNVLGTINPLEEIIRRAHAAGAVVLVDGAQAVPHMPIDVQALDCDFLAFSGHKMLGPTGIGVLYGKRELLESMPPFLGGGGMIRLVEMERFTAGDLPHKFEAGTPPIVEAIALGAAVDYLNRVGLAAIHAYELTLTRRAHECLQSLPGLRIFGPKPEQKGGIVSFALDRLHAHDVAQLLDRAGIAVRAGHHCTMPLHKRLGVPATTRASFYFYNTPEEVDRLRPALEHAMHTLRRK